jgi:paraquat-inducible protein B
MKIKISPTIVGAFVVGALLLLVFALVNFGAGGLFRQPARFVVVVRQTSISGLDPGSSVKFSGVRVGRVQSVGARLDPDTSEIVVRIICDIDEGDAGTLFPPPSPPREKVVDELVRRGMHAKLSFSGITGLMYVDLVVVPEKRGGTPEIDRETGFPIVPIQASLLAEIADTLGTIANNLAQFDFPGISKEMHTLLVNLNAVTGQLDVKGTLSRIGAAADSVHGLAADQNLRQMLERLNLVADELRQALAGVREGIPAVQDDLKRTLAEAATAMKSISEAGAEIKALAASGDGLSEEIGRALDAVSRAAEGLQQLADFVERNPSAFLRGRAESAPEAQPKKRP